MRSFFLKFIRWYQRSNFFSKPLFKKLYLSDSICRFVPSCSQYSYQAIEKYGIINGCWLAFKRIIRCHPWNKGGEDPVP